MSTLKLYSPVRHQCRQCYQYYTAKDLFIGFCRKCFDHRSKSSAKPQFDTNGTGVYRCSDCRITVREGYIHWDRTSNEFLLYCVECSNRKVGLDNLYKGTVVQK